MTMTKTKAIQRFNAPGVCNNCNLIVIMGLEPGEKKTCSKCGATWHRVDGNKNKGGRNECQILCVISNSKNGL